MKPMIAAPFHKPALSMLDIEMIADIEKILNLEPTFQRQLDNIELYIKKNDRSAFYHWAIKRDYRPERFLENVWIEQLDRELGLTNILFSPPGSLKDLTEKSFSSLVHKCDTHLSGGLSFYSLAKIASRIKDPSPEMWKPVLIERMTRLLIDESDPRIFNAYQMKMMDEDDRKQIKNLVIEHNDLRDLFLIQRYDKSVIPAENVIEFLKKNNEKKGSFKWFAGIVYGMEAEEKLAIIDYFVKHQDLSSEMCKHMAAPVLKESRHVLDFETWKGLCLRMGVVGEATHLRLIGNKDAEEKIFAETWFSRAQKINDKNMFWEWLIAMPNIIKRQGWENNPAAQAGVFSFILRNAYHQGETFKVDAVLPIAKIDGMKRAVKNALATAGAAGFFDTAAKKIESEIRDSVILVENKKRISSKTNQIDRIPILLDLPEIAGLTRTAMELASEGNLLDILCDGYNRTFSLSSLTDTKIEIDMPPTL